MKILVAALVVVNSMFAAHAVQLENWRQPLFTVAAEMERAEGSASRMFWDDISTATIFDSAIWIAPHKDRENHWWIEPSLLGGVQAPEAAGTHKLGYFHGDLLNEFRFNHLRLRQTVDLDSRYDADVYYPAHPGRSVRARIEEAYLQLDIKYGFVRLGRVKRNWGPFPDRSLVLSSSPYSYDAIEWQLTGSFFEFRHLFAAFPLQHGTWDSDNGTRNNRYLTAHALNCMLGRWVTIGVFETVLFTRSSGFPDLQYVNPASVYTVINTNYEGDGNLMLGMQWNIHPGREDVSFRGQLVFDDFQVDKKVETDNEPAHWGVDAGIYWRDPLQGVHFPHLVKLEYRRASPWLYTVTDQNADQGERYIFAAKSLGLPTTDGSRFALGTFAIPAPWWGVGVHGSFELRGGNTVMSRWQDSNHTPGLPFDTGLPVERRGAVGFDAFWLQRAYAHLKGSGELGWVKNSNNQATGTYAFDPLVAIELTFHIENFWYRLP